MSRSVEVVAPSRLHFGLFAFGNSEGRQFGGAGVMIAQPSTSVVATSAERFSASGRYTSRVEVFAHAYANSFGLAEPPACRLEVTDAPDEHHGLGLGTQLGMSVATALARIEGREGLSATQLAAAVGRGARSAIGVHGFDAGGMIIDGGKSQDESLGRLDNRVALPSEWRFVLATPAGSAGVAGAAEQDAFAQLPPPPAKTTTRLRQLATGELVPGATAADFARFSAALHEYNVIAGNCFAAVQGGPYASHEVARVVEQMQAHGCVGCGQSSWGPTVFGLAPNDAEAQRLAAGLATDGVEARVVAPNNRGAAVTVS